MNKEPENNQNSRGKIEEEEENIDSMEIELTAENKPEILRMMI
jgi:hypothetical protein